LATRSRRGLAFEASQLLVSFWNKVDDRVDELKASTSITRLSYFQATEGDAQHLQERSLGKAAKLLFQNGLGIALGQIRQERGQELLCFLILIRVVLFERERSLERRNRRHIFLAFLFRGTVFVELV
jgi:hypothetical protein